MRAALLGGALALVMAAPLGAQETSTAPDSGTPADPAPVPGSKSGPIVLLSAPAALLSRSGEGPVDPRREMCLDEGEEAIFASDRLTFSVAGAACIAPAWAEQKAFESERREAAEAALREAEQAFASAKSEEEKTAAAAQLAKARRQVWLLAPPPLLRFWQPPRRPVRTGAIRSDRPNRPPSRPVLFRVASGSPEVLARLPRGTLVQRSSALCLKPGEQVTVTASTGQSATYTGPGCLKRQGLPTRDNIGGFTFG